MITVKAQGQIRHCFFGDYFSRIVLLFATVEDARNARTALGAPWVQLTKQPRALFAELTSEQKKAFAEQYKPLTAPCERRECKKRKKEGPRHDFDALAHSIDYSPRFHVTVPVVAYVADEQLPLPQVSP